MLTQSADAQAQSVQQNGETFNQVDTAQWQLDQTPNSDVLRIKDATGNIVSVPSGHFAVIGESVYLSTAYFNAATWQISTAALSNGLSGMATLAGGGFWVVLSSQEDTEGFISNDQLTIDLGTGFTVNSDNQALYVANADFHIMGSGGDDTIGNGEDNIARYSHSVSIDLSAGGNNTLSFGKEAASNQGSLSITAGDGRDQIAFVDDAADDNGRVVIYSGGGSDLIRLGTNPAESSGEVTVHAEDGDDEIVIGSSAANQQGTLVVDAGNGADTFEIGEQAAFNTGSVTVSGNDGSDTFNIGNKAGSTSGRFIANGNDGDDTFTFGNFAGYFKGEAVANGGDGADVIVFDTEAGATFSDRPNGTIKVYLGTNSDGLTDGDRDILTFKGTVYGAEIHDYEVGIDAKITMAPGASAKIGSGAVGVFDSGTGNTTFGADDYEIVFMAQDLSGTEVSDLFAFTL